jgi:hypothetical protein
LYSTYFIIFSLCYFPLVALKLAEGLQMLCFGSPDDTSAQTLFDVPFLAADAFVRQGPAASPTTPPRRLAAKPGPGLSSAPSTVPSPAQPAERSSVPEIDDFFLFSTSATQQTRKRGEDSSLGAAPSHAPPPQSDNAPGSFDEDESEDETGADKPAARLGWDLLASWWAPAPADRVLPTSEERTGIMVQWD